jgi:hypothetical protein
MTLSMDCCYAEYLYVECSILFIVMLSVIMLSVVAPFVGKTDTL